HAASAEVDSQTLRSRDELAFLSVAAVNVLPTFVDLLFSTLAAPHEATPSASTQAKPDHHIGWLSVVSKYIVPTVGAPGLLAVLPARLNAATAAATAWLTIASTVCFLSCPSRTMAYR